MIPLSKIKNLLRAEFDNLCKQYNLENCELLICNQSELIEHSYIACKYGYLTPLQMLNQITSELHDKTNSLMNSEFVVVNGKHQNVNSYTIILLTENIYKLYYLLQLCKVDYTDEELKEFLLICLRHEIGHIIDYQTAIKTTRDLDKWFEKRSILKAKEMQEYFDYRNYLLHTFDEDGPDADYHLCKLEVEKYFNMTDEATANRLAEVDMDRLIELTIKFQAMVQEFVNY